MQEPPRSGRLDESLALLTEGYEFISRRCERLGTDVFTTRLQGQRTICLRGREAAELFYDESRFQRAGAAPRRLRGTLFGEGGVQGLDDAAHRHRKAMFLSLMTPERLDDLTATFVETWRARAATWVDAGAVTLDDESARVLTEAVYRWAGMPLEHVDLDRQRVHLHGMIVGGGGVGPRYLWGRLSRQRGNRLVERLVEAARAGDLAVEEGTPLHTIAFHRGPDGALLEPRVAAVEVLNVLRPTVAVSRYLVFLALALHEHPEWRERLRDGDDALAEAFVHEVRRTTPFFPFTAARVREEFVWRDYRFPRGRRVLLDLLGTNLDARVWDQPTDFRPDRFLDWDGDPFGLIPQGGGDHWRGHRCAGEWITIALLKATVRELTAGMDYRVPPQDLRVARGHLPARPRSGFVIDEVRLGPRVSV